MLNMWCLVHLLLIIIHLFLIIIMVVVLGISAAVAIDFLSAFKYRVKNEIELKNYLNI